LQIELDGRNDGVNDGVYPDLKKTENNVYTPIKKNPSLTAAEIASVVDLSKPTVERTITALKKKGYIVREGSTKTGRWIPQK